MAGTDDFLKRQQQLIDTYGWAVTNILPTDDDPTRPFSYTVGLTAYGYPELIIAGLGPEVAQRLLNDLARRVFDRAERFTHGQRIGDLLAGYDAIIVQGPATDALYPGAAYGHYGTERVRLQQIVWPDQHGHFPWEDGYAHHPDVQPLIGRL